MFKYKYHKNVNLFLVIFFFLSSCKDLEKKQTFEETNDCSALSGATTYWKGIQPWNYGEWEINDYGYQGRCWASAGDSREAFVSISINQSKLGVLRYWANIEPDEATVDGVVYKQVTVKEGDNKNSISWTQFQIGIINPGTHVIKLKWNYGPTNKQFRIDQITQIW